jgi:hypothetical protein
VVPDEFEVPSSPQAAKPSETAARSTTADNVRRCDTGASPKAIEHLVVPHATARTVNVKGKWDAPRSRFGHQPPRGRHAGSLP